MKYSVYAIFVAVILLQFGCDITSDDDATTSSSSVTLSQSSQFSSSSTLSQSSTESESSQSLSSLQSTSSSSSSAALIALVKDSDVNLRSIAQNGNLLFVGDYDGSLFIYDISDEVSPKLLSTFDTGDIIEDIAYYQNGLYLANDQNGLSVIDISNPSSPLLAKKVDAGYGRGIEIYGGFIYLASGYQGICAISLATLDKCNAIEVEGDYTDSIAVYDGIAYTSDSFFSKVVMTNVTSHEVVGSLQRNEKLYTPRDDVTIAANRDAIFIAEGTSGFSVYSLSTHNFIARIPVPDEKEFFSNITISHNGTKAYVSTYNYNKGIEVYDITNLSNITYLGRLVTDVSTTFHAKALAQSVLSPSEKYLYVNAWQYGVAIVALDRYSDTTSANQNSNTSSSSSTTSEATSLMDLTLWDSYGTTNYDGSTLIVGDSIGYDANDVDSDGNSYNQLIDASSTQYDYDMLISKTTYQSPLTLKFTGTIRSTSLGYNFIGFADPADSFSGTAGEGTPITTNRALLGFRWEENGVLNLYVDGHGYITTNVKASSGELSGNFMITYDGSNVSYYYNDTLLSTQSLSIDTQKGIKLYVKTYESAFDFSSMSIQ